MFSFYSIFMVLQFVGVAFLSAAATLAVVSDDPADYNFVKSENIAKIACETCVGIWILALILQEISQMYRYNNIVFAIIVGLSKSSIVVDADVFA